MVNLLPEEMKREEQEDKGLEVSKEEEKKKENIKMTTPIKDKSPKKQKKTWGFFPKFWGFIFKKNKKERKNQSLKKDVFSKNQEKKEKPEVKKDEDSRREEKISKNFGVSLMPKQTIVISRVVRSRLLFLVVSIIIISILFFVARLYGGWHFDKLESRVEYLKREIVLLGAQTAPLLENRDNITVLTNKAAEVKRALDNHVYWTNFFTLLETYTVPDVYFGDFRAQAGENVKLVANSRSLISLAQQIVAFNNAPDFIEKVNVSNIQKSDEGASAFFDLTLIDGVWQK